MQLPVRQRHGRGHAQELGLFRAYHVQNEMGVIQPVGEVRPCPVPMDARGMVNPGQVEAAIRRSLGQEHSLLCEACPRHTLLWSIL